MSKSIINNQKRCYRCGAGSWRAIHKHHIFRGPFRDKSEKWGCWVYLCADHHVGNHGVHNTTEGQAYWLQLKKIAQTEFEKRHGHELFMKEFKRNYLEE